MSGGGGGGAGGGAWWCGGMDVVPMPLAGLGFAIARSGDPALMPLWLSQFKFKFKFKFKGVG